MAIHSKRINKRQKEVLSKYENLCGFEPMHQEDFDAGKITFRDLWNENVYWLECVLAEVQEIDTKGAFGDEDDIVQY